MLALSSTSTLTRCQEILSTTVKHCSLHVPEPLLRLDRSEFVDPPALDRRGEAENLAQGGT